MKEIMVDVIFNAEDLIKYKNTKDQTKENDLKMHDQIIKQHVESVICYNKLLYTITMVSFYIYYRILFNTFSKVVFICIYFVTYTVLPIYNYFRKDH